MKTIDQAINEHKGTWPEWASISGEPLRWCSETRQWFQMSPVANERGSYVCTRPQFARRVRYLSKYGMRKSNK